MISRSMRACQTEQKKEEREDEALTLVPAKKRGNGPEHGERKARLSNQGLVHAMSHQPQRQT